MQQTEDALVYTQGLNAAGAAEIEQVNKKRRFSQMNEYDTFYRVHSKVHSLFSKNIELEKECLSIESQIQKYEEELLNIEVRI